MEASAPALYLRKNEPGYTAFAVYLSFARCIEARSHWDPAPGYRSVREELKNG
jgi:hypothetical protein